MTMADPMSAEVEIAETMVRRVAHSLPPIDFGSTAAIREMAAAIEERDAAIRAQARAEALREAIEKLDSARIDCASDDRATGFYVGIRSAQRQIAELAAERTERDG